MRISNTVLVASAALFGLATATPCVIPQIIHQMPTNPILTNKTSRAAMTEFIKLSVISVLDDKKMVCSFDMVERLYHYMEDHIIRLHDMQRQALGWSKDVYNSYLGVDLPPTALSKEVGDMEDFASRWLGKAFTNMDKIWKLGGGLAQLHLDFKKALDENDDVRKWLEYRAKQERREETMWIGSFYDNHRAIVQLAKIIRSRDSVDGMPQTLVAADPLGKKGANVAVNVFAVVAVRDRASSTLELVQFELDQRQRPYTKPIPIFAPTETKKQWNSDGAYAMDRFKRLESVLELEEALPFPRSLEVAKYYKRAFQPLLLEASNIEEKMRQALQKMGKNASEGWVITLWNLRVLWKKVFGIKDEYERIYRDSKAKGTTINSNGDGGIWNEGMMLQKGL